MSYSNATGRFDLDKVYLRKPLVYPDGTTQSTASSPPVSLIASNSITSPITLGTGGSSINILPLTTLVPGIIQISGNIVVNTDGSLTNLILIVENDETSPIFRSSQQLNTTGTNQSFYIPICFTYRESGTSTQFRLRSDYTAPGGTENCDLISGKVEAFWLGPL